MNVLIPLGGVLPPALRPATAGGAYCGGWEAGAAAAARLPVTDRAPLWPASARRHYWHGYAGGYAATAEYLGARVTQGDLSTEEPTPAL